MMDPKVVVLDGQSLTTSILYAKLSQPGYKIKVSDEAWARVEASHRAVNKIVKDSEATCRTKDLWRYNGFWQELAVSYRPSTSSVSIIRSHSTGVGQPLSPERTRMLMALRINVLCKGGSGVTPGVLKAYVDAYNESCLPIVPEKGTVGASGDLAHWNSASGKEVLRHHKLKPLDYKTDLQPKDGLSLVNGAQLITSLGSEAVERAGAIARQADVVTAMTVQVLRGSAAPYRIEVHDARRHIGQGQSAARLRQLLDLTRYPEANLLRRPGDPDDEVQDPYSMRCAPQVHGVACDTVEMVRNWLNTEINSVTDNPIVVDNEIFVGGNFHGEYPAKGLDYLAIGVHELASISERRIDKMMHGKEEKTPDRKTTILPKFLVNPVPEEGLNSGFMIAHCTAASLVSENKGLCHPASVDSIPTSDGQENHVSMGGWSARKAVQVVENVETVLGIELLAGCQGMFLREMNQTEKPILTAPLQKVYDLVKGSVKLDVKDTYLGPGIETAVNLLRHGEVWKQVEEYFTAE